MATLLLAELRRSWLVFRRYPGEAATLAASLTAVFLFLFLGLRWVAGPPAAYGDRLDALIVGYALWGLTVMTLVVMGWNLQIEAQTGTLEQLALSPHGAVRLLLARGVAELAVQLAVAGVVLAFALAVTGRTLPLTAAALGPLAAILLGAWGLGFVLAGLCHLLKRIQHLVQLSQFVLLFLVMFPLEQWESTGRPLAHLLPLTSGAALMRDVVARGEPLGLLPLAAALASGAAWLVVGITFFRRADRQARLRGLLGQH